MILALALLLPLLAGLALGAPADDPRPIVSASEILAKIERGEPVEYEGVIVVGNLGDRRLAHALAIPGDAGERDNQVNA